MKEQYGFLKLTREGRLENLSKITGVLEFAKQVRKRFGPAVREIILFGSKARSEGRQDSDIDILIVPDRLSWQIKSAISEMAAEENIKHGVLISTVRYDVKTWEDPVIKSSPFGVAVRNEGLQL